MPIYAIVGLVLLGLREFWLVMELYLNVFRSSMSSCMALMPSLLRPMKRFFVESSFCN